MSATGSDAEPRRRTGLSDKKGLPDQKGLPGNFATTSWSLVQRAAGGVADAGAADAAAAASALGELCQAYWYPLYAHVRRLGHDANTAQDLTQAFFADVLERKILGAADQHRGRFRTFLLASLKHFIANQWRQQQAEKRGGGRAWLSLDFDQADQRYSSAAASPLSLENDYEKQWALQVLELALQALQREYERAGNLQVFQSLREHLSPGSGVRYAEVAQALGQSESAIKVAIHRMRQRYGQQIRLEIAKTINDPSEIEDELQSLFAAVSN